MSERFARIERVEGGTSDGTFAMTLATDGEASDGHILNIRGGVVPERIPLLSSHVNDPAFQLGSITNAEKDTRKSPARLRAVGHIELEGDGERAEARRDLAHMIHAGHTAAVSIRWEELPGSPPLRRIDLEPDHPARVDPKTETDFGKLNGYYFDSWRALEGSVVSIGADPAALIGRSQSAQTGEMRSFWRGLVEQVDVEGQELVALAAAARASGMDEIDIINAVALEDDIDADAWTCVTLGDCRMFMPSAAATALQDLKARADRPEPEAKPADRQAPEEPKPLPAVITSGATFRALQAEFERHAAETRADSRALLDAALGRVARHAGRQD